MDLIFVFRGIIDENKKEKKTTFEQMNNQTIVTCNFFAFDFENEHFIIF